MIVELRALKPNPLRDFRVDPIDPENVAQLKASIEEDGFWGGVVCRARNGHIEIAAGHHRVEAAIQAGIEKADLFVSPDLSDRAMLRIYARENATQRGNMGTAQAGSVAAALRIAARAVLMDDLSQICERSQRALEVLQGQIATDRGLGEPLLTDLLEGVPNLKSREVSKSLAGIKESGAYARIIREVGEGIVLEAEAAAAEARRLEAEQAAAEAQEAAKAAAAEAAEARKRADAAAAAAAKKERTFDLEGVQKILKNPEQLDIFRKRVQGEGLKPYLSVDQQAAAAQALVDLAKERNQEFTATFIAEHLGFVVSELKREKQRLSAEEKERLLRLDWEKKADDLQEGFLRAIRSLASYGDRLHEHLDARPKGGHFVLKAPFRSTLADARRVINALDERINK